MRAVLLLLAGLALCAPPAIARDVTDAERTALAARIAGFDEAMRAEDYAAIVGTIPPGIIDQLAKSYGVEAALLRERLPAMMQTAAEKVTLLNFEMMLDDATFPELPDGTPYALIPTETIFQLKDGGKTYLATADTLAVLDNGTWYLVRVSEQAQVDALVAVYPGFASVTFAPSETEVYTE